MRPLIEKGHLYIAQPPLYRVKRGQSETYLKDERAMEQYLLDTGTHNMQLRLENGSTLSGMPLRQFCDHALKVYHSIKALLRRLNQPQILEALWMAGYFNDPESFQSDDALARLRQSEQENATWRLERLGDVLTVHRKCFGVEESWRLDSQTASSPEARSLIPLRDHIVEVFSNPVEILSLKDPSLSPLRIFAVSQFIDYIFEQGRKGLSISRYKGLGEMNPEQLWETTLNPDVRTLLQVKLEHLEEAEEIFSTLMGDLVEPRRDFITTNALKVVNLDV
jgi:DNA gyrase subunit B